ncbi:MAG: hypothetical protein QXW05_00110 [Ignisphaera sp.]|uniref:Uncharacterized protein n=1 Tax=Ignisphaera aggregans TaxID=334771 RepID=A0A7C4D2U8_9CREN
MSVVELHKSYLTILVWGLICEIIVLIYYLSNNRYTFEFYLTLGLLPITLGGIMAIVRAIKKEVSD